MGTNAESTANQINFWPVKKQNFDLITGAETKVNLTASPLDVGKKSDFYKDMAVVNDTTNNQAVALDVPCGLRPTELIANVWAMVSAPCGNNVNNTGASIADIFGDDIGGTYGDNGNWIMYKDGSNYTGKSSDNDIVPAGDSMELGKGYWIITDKVGVKLKADALAIQTRTQLNTTNANGNIAGYYEFALPAVTTTNPVKIMVGNPFPRTIKWIDVRENNAPLGSKVNSTAWVYDPASTSSQPYSAITATTPGLGGEIAPYGSVWIKKIDQAATNVTLDLPFEK